MKTIFAKYNSERLAKYQIVTKIVEDENGSRFAIKKALCEEAKEHIEDICKNYDLLTSAYDINLVKATLKDDEILFEMAAGVCLENILVEALNQNDIEKFQKYIDKFLGFVDSMVYKRDVLFEPSEEFKNIFGNWEIEKPQDIIKLANIDLIFGNIFVDEKDNFTLIDYEWVFDFEVPKSFVLFRTFYPFYEHFVKNHSSKNFKEYIENYLDIEDFLKLENNFYVYVFGEKRKYFLPPQVAKEIVEIVSKQELEQIKQNLQKKEQELEQTKQELEQIKQNLQKKEQELEQTKQELVGVYTSKSWKITRPLRYVMRVLKRNK